MMQEVNLENVEKETVEFLEEEITKKEEQVEEEKRWTYFLVNKVEQEFNNKNELKKWVQENGIGTLKIIRGRKLSTRERVKRIVSIS
jgi:hypothetical protein